MSLFKLCDKSCEEKTILLLLKYKNHEELQNDKQSN